MVPAPAADARLPLDLAARNALDALRTPAALPRRAAAVAALLAALPSPPPPAHPAVSYTLCRLAAGAAASAGGARANMPLALAGLAAALAGDGAVVDPAVDAVAGVYGPGGSFVADYAGAERERAVGALAACAAVVSAAREVAARRGAGGAPVVGGAAAKELAGILRAAADAGGGKWALGVPCVMVVRDLVAVVPRPDFDSSLAKPLLKWCRDRARAADGAALALVLHVELAVVAAPAFAAVYPKPDPLHAALADCFEQGFPLWRRGPADASMPPVPVQWALAMRLAAMQTPASRSALGGAGVDAFWTGFVVQSLVCDTSSADKKTLAVALFPLAVRASESASTFAGLLCDSVASFLTTALTGRHGAAGAGGGARRRNNRSGAGERLHQAASALGRALLDEIRDKQRRGLKNAGAWARQLLSWAARKRLANRLFKGDALRFAASLMTEADLDGLFRDVVKTLAQPQCTPREVAPVRSDAVHLLANLFGAQSERAHDVVRVLALYGVFACAGRAGERLAVEEAKKMTKEGAEALEEERDAACVIKAMRRHKPGGERGEADFAGLAPRAAPDLSPATTEMIFRQVADLAASGRPTGAGAASATLIDTALSFIHAVAETREARGVDFRSANLHLKPDLDAVVQRVVTLPAKLAALPVVRSVLILTQFLTLYLYDPLMDVNDPDAAVSPATYARVLGLLGPCLQAVKDEAAGAPPPSGSTGAKKGRKAKTRSAKEVEAEEGGGDEGGGEEEEEREPTSLEQMVYILVTVCRQHSATLRHIAASAFEVIAEVADSSVTAVIFDLLETDGTDTGGGGDAVRGEATEGDEKEMNIDVEADGSGDSDDSADDDDDDDDSDEEGGTGSVSEDGRAGEDGPGRAEEKGSGGEGDGESEEGDLTNIMLDDEDPAALEAYDKHLSNHMRLIKVEKKKNRRVRQQTARRASGAARLLDIVELLGRRLRLRLETDDSCARDTLFTFLDLLVRMMEHGYGRDVDGAAHLDRLVTIFCKHLDRPLSSYADKRLAEEDAAGLLARSFGVLTAADGRRRAGSSEQRMIAQACTVICRSSPSGGALLDKISAGYGGLWEQFRSPGNRFIGMNMFTSAAARVPELTAALTKLGVDTVLEPTSSSGTRTLALQVLHSYVPAVRKLAEAGDESRAAASFWGGVGDILNRGAGNVDGDVRLWKHGASVGDLLRLVEAGLQGGELRDTDGVGSSVAALLGQLKVPRPTERKMRKTVNAIYRLSPPAGGAAGLAGASESPTDKRKGGAGGELGGHTLGAKKRARQAQKA